MLNKLDTEFCNDIRRYGRFITRYDDNKNGTKEYDDTRSILIYEYENNTYYLIMERGEYINYLWD